MRVCGFLATRLHVRVCVRASSPHVYVYVRESILLSTPSSSRRGFYITAHSLEQPEATKTCVGRVLYSRLLLAPLFSSVAFGSVHRSHKDYFFNCIACHISKKRKYSQNTLDTSTSTLHTQLVVQKPMCAALVTCCSRGPAQPKGRNFNWPVRKTAPLRKLFLSCVNYLYLWLRFGAVRIVVPSLFF